MLVLYTDLIVEASCQKSNDVEVRGLRVMGAKFGAHVHCQISNANLIRNDLVHFIYGCPTQLNVLVVIYEHLFFAFMNELAKKV